MVLPPPATDRHAAIKPRLGKVNLADLRIEETLDGLTHIAASCIERRARDVMCHTGDGLELFELGSYSTAGRRCTGMCVESA